VADRITNADVERLLREMSPAARRYARDIDAVLWLIRSGSAAHALESLGDALGSCKSSLCGDELQRAFTLRHALWKCIWRRYEIVDRWGKQCC